MMLGTACSRAIARMLNSKNVQWRHNLGLAPVPSLLRLIIALKADESFKGSLFPLEVNILWSCCERRLGASCWSKGLNQKSWLQRPPQTQHSKTAGPTKTTRSFWNGPYIPCFKSPIFVYEHSSTSHSLLVISFLGWYAGVLEENQFYVSTENDQWDVSAKASVNVSAEGMA